MNNRDESRQANIYSDHCLWYPAFAKAVFEKHSEVFDGQFINYREIFSLELIGSEPVMLAMSLMLLDRILSVKSKIKDLAYPSDFPSQNEWLLYVALDYAKKFCVDRRCLFIESKRKNIDALLRESTLTLMDVEGLNLRLRSKDLPAFLRCFSQQLSDDDQALFLGHLFHLKVLMSASDENINAEAALSRRVLAAFKRKRNLFYKLAQEVQALKLLPLMKYDEVFLNYLLRLMVKQGCFNKKARASVESVMPAFNHGLSGFCDLAMKECKIKFIYTLSPINMLNAAIEYKALSSRFHGFNEMLNDAGELENAMLDYYFNNPRLSGFLTKIFTDLFQAGVFDLLKHLDIKEKRTLLFEIIYVFIENEGRMSTDEVFSEVTNAMRAHFQRKSAPLMQIVYSPLIPNFPYYREMMVDSLTQLYEDLLHAANKEDSNPVLGVYHQLKSFSKEQLLGLSHIAKILHRTPNLLAYQLFELVLNNMAYFDIFKEVIITCDLYFSLRVITIADFNNMLAMIVNASAKEPFESLTKRAALVRQMVNEMVYRLVESNRYSISSNDVLNCVKAFSLDLSPLIQAAEGAKQVLVTLKRPSQLSIFSYIIQPISSSTSTDETLSSSDKTMLSKS